MKLLACPFCGNGSIQISHCEYGDLCCGGRPLEVNCTCGCTLKVRCATDEEAIEKWNARKFILNVTSNKEIFPTYQDQTLSNIAFKYGCVSARYCDNCHIIVGSSCMCLVFNCKRCGAKYSDTPHDTTGIKRVNEYELENGNV